MQNINARCDICGQPFLIVRNETVIEVSQSFYDITGYFQEELLNSSIEGLFKTLRVGPSADIYSIDEKKDYFLFTKSLEVRFVNIRIIDEGQEKLYIFLEKSESYLDSKLAFANVLCEENYYGIAIYSMPDITLLKANKKHISFLDEPFNKKENCIGRQISEITAGFIGSAAEDVWNMMANTGDSYNIDEYMYNGLKRGITYWKSSGFPIFVEDDIKFCVVITSEITEQVLHRKKVEEQAKTIKRQNEQLRWQADLLNLSTDAIFAWDLNGGIVYWNKGAEQMYGYSREEAIGSYSHSLLKTVHPESFENIKSTMLRNGVWNGEIEHIRKDGSKIHIETKHQVITDEQGKVIVLETNRDVTGRKQAEEKIHWNKLRAEILCEVTEKLLKSSRPQEIVQELCMRVMEFLQCDVFFNYLIDEERLQLNLNACAGVSNETAKEIEWLDYGIAVCGCAARDNCRIVAENIQTTEDVRTNLVKSFGVRAYACHPLMEQDKVIGTLSFGTKSRDFFSEDDLSLMKAVADEVAIAMNRIRTEEMLIKQQQLMLKSEREKIEALEKAMEMKDEFLSIISHEFRTPLNVINSAIQAMKYICADQLPDKAKKYLGMIRQNTFRQLRLVNNLLDITRVNAGSIKINKKNVDIVFLTRAITESVHAYASQKGVSVTFASSVKKKIVGMDDEKYERILLNLLSNAIKFTPKGKSIVVKLRSIKGNICIEVRDYGIGMPPDKIDLIFERFGQVDSSLSRQAEGTGIGLSLVKKFMEALGGSISVKSELGKGSTFTILIPNEKIAEEHNEKVRGDLLDNRLVETINIEFSDIYL